LHGRSFTATVYFFFGAERIFLFLRLVTAAFAAR
jgi:hypothetical protein